MKTKRDLEFGRPYSAVPSAQSKLLAPKGTHVIHAGGLYWLDSTDPLFAGKPILKHDADTYGFCVNDEDVEV